MVPVIGCLSNLNGSDKTRLEDVISNLSSAIAKEMLNEVRRSINIRNNNNNNNSASTS